MIDRQRAIELVAQGMVEAYSSNDCPRAPDIEEATKIVDGLLALVGEQVPIDRWNELIWDLSKLAKDGPYEGEDSEELLDLLRAKLEHQREAMRALIDALEQDTIPGRVGVPYARVKAILANGGSTDPLVSDLEHRLRVLAEAAVEDEAEIERLRVVEDAARVLARCADPLGAYPQTYQALQILRATLRDL